MEATSGNTSETGKSEMADSVYSQGINKALGVEELLSRISRAAQLKRQYLTQLRTKIAAREKNCLYSKKVAKDITLPYQFKKEDDPRSWIKDVFWEEEKEWEDMDSDGEVTEEDYHEMLKLHMLRRKCSKALLTDASLTRYRHYSSDFVTNRDEWPSHRRSFKQGKKKKIKEDKVKQDIASENAELSDISGPKDNESNQASKSPQSQLSQTKKKKVNIDAIRKRHWKAIAKKDIPRAYRIRAQVRGNNTALLRRVSRESMKKQRAISALSVKISKDKAGRARRITREMQLFWKKYSKVEKVHRRKAEKHALEQIRLDEEMREAKRQQRKLNFLISQTEIFAHFISKKLSKEQVGLENDERIKSILNSLEKDYADEANTPRSGFVSHLSETEENDGAYYCDQAMSNVKEAIKKQRSQTAAFDESDSRAGDFSDSYSLVNPSISADEDIPQPSLFKGSLKTYQLKGMNWLINLYEQGINGILADEMGLGKTVQTIAFLGHLAEKINVWGPFLVVAPASTLNNWHQELTKFFPDFKVLPYWGNPADRKVLRKFWNQKASYHSDRNSAPFHILVTSYQLVITDVRYFQRIKWQYMVLDEAQALKSTSSVRWKSLLDFKCRNRLLLTGTPIQNTMAELWALLHFIMPSLFDSHDEFNEWFSKDIENHIENKSNMDETQLSRLHMILKPFMLRRIKRDVENELSEKIEVLVHCGLAPRQQKLYNGIKQNIKVEDLLKSSGGTYISTGSGNTLMNLVMQFRKVCNHPDLFDRRDVTSPYHANHLPPFLLPKLVYHEGMLSRVSPGKKKLLYCDLNIHHPLNVHRNKCFSFLFLFQIHVSEYWETLALGTQFQLHLAERVYRAKKRQYFQETFRNHQNMEVPHQSLVLSPMFLSSYCPHSPLQQMLFVQHLSTGYIHINSHLSHKQEGRCEKGQTGLELLLMPKVLLVLFTPAVTAPLREIYCCDRGACNEFLRPVFGKLTAVLLFGIYEGNTDRLLTIPNKQTVFSKDIAATGGLTSLKPPGGWSSIKIPDKEYLVIDSGKLYALDILLRRLKSEGHRVLIYSQMTRMIDILEEYMWYRRHSYIRLDGSSRISERRDMVADFQSRSDIFAFLLSTRAGGLGINLTAADTVIFYDSDWNPTVDQQAMDRAHRLGQTKQVTVYRLVCQGTVDERILKRAEEKNAIQRMVIAGGSFRPDALKTKEVVSLLLDDEQLLQRLKMKREENKGEILPYKGKKRGRKTNAEREAKRLKQLEEQGVTGTIADSAAGNVTIMHSESSSPVTPGLFEAKFLSSSVLSSQDADSECGSFFDSAPVSPESAVSGGSDLKIVEDDAIVVDDMPGETPSPVQSTRILHGRGRGGGRGRGRPRIRPLMPEPQRRRSRVSTSRGATRGRRSSRARRIFTGRAAAMAGARAGAVAASAATYATYGYGLEPSSSILQQKDKSVSNSSSVT